MTKLRVDFSYDLAILQKEKGRKDGPRVGALVKANHVMRKLKKGPGVLYHVQGDRPAERRADRGQR